MSASGSIPGHVDPGSPDEGYVEEPAQENPHANPPTAVGVPIKDETKKPKR